MDRARTRTPASPAAVFEPLELRALLSASPAVESIDGTNNNPAQPLWGSVGQDLLRTAPAQYADGTSALAGAMRPALGPSAALSSQTLQTAVSPTAVLCRTGSTPGASSSTMTWT